MTFILLFFYLHLSYLASYPEIYAAPTPQRIFFKEQMEVIAENHPWPKCKEQLIMGSPAPIAIFATQILHLQGTSWRKGRSIVRAREPGNLVG